MLALPGEALVKAGEKGAGLFLMMKGAVQFVRDGVKLHTLHAIAAFGESSLLERSQLPTASVLAVRYCELSVLIRRDFLAIVRTNPDLMRHLQAYAAKQHAPPVPTVTPTGLRRWSEETSSSSRHGSGHTAPSDLAQVGGVASATDTGGGWDGGDGSGARVRPWRLLLPWLVGGRGAAVAPLSESHPAMQRCSSQRSEATERTTQRAHPRHSSDRSPDEASTRRRRLSARRSSAAGLMPSSLTRPGSFGSAEDDDGSAAVQEAAGPNSAAIPMRHASPRAGLMPRAL